MSLDGVQKIIGEIEKSTEKKISAILSEARQKADAILNEARQKAAEQESSIVTRGEQDARRESQRILAEARIKAKREKVNAREEMVQKSFNSALDTLNQMAKERSVKGIQYADVLIRLIKESAVASGAGSLEVLLTSRDRDLVSHDILQGISRDLESGSGSRIDLRMSEDLLSGIGGVVVRGVEGKVRVDNTFEARIERFRETVRTQVAKELFGQEL